MTEYEYPSFEEFNDNLIYIDESSKPHYVFGGCYDGTSVEDAYLDVYGEPRPE